MIKSSICLDCICAPMCISKPASKLITDCAFVDQVIDRVTDILAPSNDETIFFRGLNVSIGVSKNKYGSRGIWGSTRKDTI